MGYRPQQRLWQPFLTPAGRLHHQTDQQQQLKGSAFYEAPGLKWCYRWTFSRVFGFFVAGAASSGAAAVDNIAEWAQYCISAVDQVLRAAFFERSCAVSCCLVALHVPLSFGTPLLGAFPCFASLCAAFHYPAFLDGVPLAAASGVAAAGAAVAARGAYADAVYCAAAVLAQWHL